MVQGLSPSYSMSAFQWGGAEWSPGLWTGRWPKTSMDTNKLHVANGELTSKMNEVEIFIPAEAEIKSA